MSNHIKPNAKSETEIDLSVVIQHLINESKSIIKILIIFICLGLLIALFSKKEFTASSTFILQADESMNVGGNLSSLAAVAGINLQGTNSNNIPPNIYPKVLSSVPFKQSMLAAELTFDDLDSKVSLKEYYHDMYSPGIFELIKKYTINLPREVLKLFRNNTDENSTKSKEWLALSKNDKELIKRLDKQILLEYNKKDNYIKLTAIMPEAFAAAEMAQHAQTELQKTVTKFKIQKAQDQLVFIQSRLNEVSKQYDAAQENLALFTDQNKNVSTAAAQIRLKKLQDDYDLIYSIKSELAKQIEAQKIKVKEDSPVFTIIDPVSIPYEKSAPKRFFILFMWTFLGLTVGIAYVIAKRLFKHIKFN